MAMRINGRSTSLILPAFAKLVALDPKARDAIAVALAKRPPWRESFLDAAVAANMTPDDARALVAEVRRLSPTREPQAEEAFLVRVLVTTRQYRAARALFESYRGGGRQPVVTDGRFTGSGGMPPFAWTFKSTTDGTAEIASGPAGARAGLEVSLFGDEQIVLAEQSLAAPAGSYTLSSRASGESSSPDIHLFWNLVCLPSLRPIGALPLRPMVPSVRPYVTTVTIPASGCEGQGLALVSQPGDVSRTLNAQIAEVALVPTGGAARR